MRAAPFFFAKIVKKAAILAERPPFFYHCLHAPHRFDLQYKEHDGKQRKHDERDHRPPLHFAFQRAPLVLAEKGFARTAESVDTRRVAGLEKHDEDGNDRADRHSDQQNKADDLIRRIKRRVRSDQ